MSTRMLLTAWAFEVVSSTTLSSILEVVGTPGQELEPEEETPPSKDVVPGHEQDREDPQARRRDGHDGVVGDHAALGEVGQGPVDGEQHGQEPGDREQGSPREDEAERDQDAGAGVEAE